MNKNCEFFTTFWSKGNKFRLNGKQNDKIEQLSSINDRVSRQFLVCYTQKIVNKQFFTLKITNSPLFF